MSFIKSFFKGTLIVLFLPLYWLYAIIWFIAFRGKLNEYPRVKKDETAKHLIFATISIFAFIIFGNAYVEETTAKENVKNANKYIELTELSSVQNEEQLYTSLLDDESIENVGENESEETTDIVEIEIDSSKGISPYYHPSVEEDSVSEQAYYETSSQSDNNNYEQTDEKDYIYEYDSESDKTSIDNEFIPDNSHAENDTFVWVDDTAEKYHTSRDTPNHPNAKMNAPRQVTLTEALNMGKEPCGICYR